MGERQKVKTIKLHLDSRLEEVFLVGLTVRGVCAATPLSATEASQMEVCVVEAVNNAIKHSYHLDSGHEVEIIIALYPEMIEFSITNSGEPMNSREAARINLPPGDVRGLPKGGLGLFIIKTIMDEVSYRCSEGKNIITMAKHFPPGLSLR
jgi:serine/threonine-protein kinase RsbW